MRDPFEGLYQKIAARKNEKAATAPYSGGNGRIDRAVDLIRNDPRFPKSGILVDVGGATGNLGYALRDLFDDRWVVDICADCEEPAKAKGNKFRQSNIDRDGLREVWQYTIGTGVDLIVALDLIEHVIDPQQFVIECMTTLRPGGMVLINTPNIQYWRHLESLVVKGQFPHTSGDQEVYHGGHVAFYNYFDLQTLFNTFEDHKMHIENLKADPPPPLWTNLARYEKAPVHLSYADLIFSCRRPS